MLDRRAFKKAKHERERKLKRKLLKINILKSKVVKSKAIRFTKNPNSIDHDVYEAPDKLSIIEDPDLVIEFFSQASKSLAKGRFVRFNLSSVKVMGPETLTYYCALLNSKEFVGESFFVGNYPTDEGLRKMFQVAGFRNHVNGDNVIEASNRDITGELIHRVSREKVESRLAAEVCLSALKHSFNTDQFKNQNYYPVLIECMDNTVGHSNYGKKEAVYNWWLLAYKTPDSNITKFCFLDLGVGIFGSLNKKFKENNLGKRLLGKVFPENNLETLKQIFEGEKKTSTGKKERGLGINNIFDIVVNDPTIHDFTILSNNVIAKIGYNIPQEIKLISNNFNGTLFYWEIHP